MIEFEEEGLFQVEVVVRDCRLILDNVQIIMQLIDFVYGLEFYGDQVESVELGSVILSFGFFLSLVLILDVVDYFVELVIFELFKGRGIGGVLFF